MKKEPKISVIVPVYKVEQYLEKCVNSIINQTYKNLEIILVDDGSPDTCPALCDSLAKTDKRVKVIHKKNGGVSAARNDGISQATGDFVAFVDSDDWISSTMYESLIKKQQENDCDLVFCKYNIVDGDKVFKFDETALKPLCENKDISHFFNRSSDINSTDSQTTINNNVMCNIWRILFKKELIEDIKFDSKIKYMEDLVFMCKVFEKNINSIGFVDEFLYFYLKREGSAGVDKSSGILENCLVVISELSKTLKTKEHLKLLSAFKFFCYGECVLSKYVFGANISFENIKEWSSKQNYKNLKSISFGFKTKLKYFLIKHKLFTILKIIYKIK